jgi:hypothetical protein
MEESESVPTHPMPSCLDCRSLNTVSCHVNDSAFRESRCSGFQDVGDDSLASSPCVILFHQERIDDSQSLCLYGRCCCCAVHYALIAACHVVVDSDLRRNGDESVSLLVAARSRSRSSLFDWSSQCSLIFWMAPSSWRQLPPKSKAIEVQTLRLRLVIVAAAAANRRQMVPWAASRTVDRQKCRITVAETPRLLFLFAFYLVCNARNATSSSVPT